MLQILDIADKKVVCTACSFSAFLPISQQATPASLPSENERRHFDMHSEGKT